MDPGIDPEKLRATLEDQLSQWSNLQNAAPSNEEKSLALAAWHKYEMLTSSLAQELCEQLRLILEPSLATKLKYVDLDVSCLIAFPLTMSLIQE